MLTPKQLESVADTLIPMWDELKDWITLDIIKRLMARLGRGEDISLSATDEWELAVYEEVGGFLEDLQQRIVQTVRLSENEVRNIFLERGRQAVSSDNSVFNSAGQNNKENDQAQRTSNTQAQTNQSTAESNGNVPILPGNLPVSNETNVSSNVIAPLQTTPQSEISQSQRSENPLNNISDRIKDIMQDAYERTNGELRNFTRTTANSYRQELIKELDNAYLKVTSGAQGQWQAAQEAVDNIIKHQGCVTYPSGHVDTIEVAVIRAIRTGVARMSAALAVEGAKEHGWNHVLVSSHLGARIGDGTESPGNHEWWQGKVYTIDGESSIELDGETVVALNLELVTGYPSDPTGLCGYNCRHNLTPWTSGMRNPFKHYDSEENKKAYELSQKQRAYERAIRKAKTEVAALSAALDNCTDEKLRESLNGRLNTAKLKRDKLIREYKDFCKENNIKVLYERMYVARTPRTLEQLENKSANYVANSGGNGIIEKKEIEPLGSINSIEYPIEQRNTGKGNPNAVLMFGVELNNRQKGLLEKLPEFDSRIIVEKNSVNMADLSALTAHTGHEFAMFTKGNERLILRGNSYMVNIDIAKAKELSKIGYKWSGHTHPGIDFLCMQPSDGVYAVLKSTPHISRFSRRI